MTARVASGPSGEPNTPAPSQVEASPLIEIAPDDKIRIVFLVLNPEVWPSLASVWRRASKDERFIAVVVVLKHANPDMALPLLANAQRMLQSAGIPYFTEQNFSLDQFRPNVMFFPLPYGEMYPESYKPETIAATGCRVAYVTYGLEVGGGAYNARYQYDTEVPRVAWRVFARSQGQLTNFSRYCSHGSGHVVVTGHPRVEELERHDFRPHRQAKEKAKERAIVLWTPHFSVTTRRKWSSFLDYSEVIPRLIDEQPDLFLLVRPHPLLRARLNKLEGWGPDRAASWFDKINQKDNVHVDEGADYRCAFDTSSGLLADAGSFLVEYLCTGKPVCHLTGRDDIGLSEEVRGLDCFYPGATPEEIAGFLDKVASREDPLSELRAPAVEKYFGSGTQEASMRILEEIAQSISSRSHRRYSPKPPASARHEDVFHYWTRATSTFLAPEAYYQKQETRLRDILSRHARGRFAADVGCGNGRFTQIIGEHFEFTEATDPSEFLVREARLEAERNGITNISYTVERLEHPESLSTYDFVACMGVTSGFMDDEVFLGAIWKLRAAMLPGARLLMKDSLSLGTQEFVEWDDYRAVYRNHMAYLHAFEAAGLTLLEQDVLARDDEQGRLNCFSLFAAESPRCDE